MIHGFVCLFFFWVTVYVPFQHHFELVFTGRTCTNIGHKEKKGKMADV